MSRYAYHDSMVDLYQQRALAAFLEGEHAQSKQWEAQAARHERAMDNLDKAERLAQRLIA